MENKKTKIIIIGIIALGGLCYFLFYVPHEQHVSYQQDIVCSSLVAKYETVLEEKIVQVMGNTSGLIFDLPKSHFNKKLNTCLGDLQSNYSVYTASAGQIIYSKSIIDVISNDDILTSVTESSTSKGVSTTTLSSGVSADDFKKQETILMSE